MVVVFSGKRVRCQAGLIPGALGFRASVIASMAADGCAHIDVDFCRCLGCAVATRCHGATGMSEWAVAAN